MKKNLFIVALLICSTFIFAHSPSDITLKFDSGKKTLSVNVAHDISQTKNPDPKKHFVKEIVVSVNDVVISTKTFTSQKTLKGELASIKLDVKANDKVTVKASCSLNGSKSVDLVIK